LIFAAEPYENIAFRIESRELEKNEKFFTHYDKDAQVFTLQLLFKSHLYQQVPPVHQQAMMPVPMAIPAAAMMMHPPAYAPPSQHQ
jgi:splicing factor 3A subunit 2